MDVSKQASGRRSALYNAAEVLLAAIPEKVAIQRASQPRTTEELIKVSEVLLTTVLCLATIQLHNYSELREKSVARLSLMWIYHESSQHANSGRKESTRDAYRS